MMYQAYQNHMDLTSPWRTGAAAGLKYLNLVPQGVSDRVFRRLAASLELISRSSLTYARPAYGIETVLVGNQELEVNRGSHLRHPVRLAAALQEGEFAGAAAAVAGGADVRPFRHAVARHREDAAAGPRRLHHRLA
jgi:poly-beta-hydroxyalkanoate depolymerase